MSSILLTHLFTWVTAPLPYPLEVVYASMKYYMQYAS